MTASLDTTLAGAKDRLRALSGPSDAATAELEAMQSCFRWIFNCKSMHDAETGPLIEALVEFSVPQSTTESAVLARSAECERARDYVPAVFLTVPEGYGGIIKTGEVVFCLRNEFELFAAKGAARAATEAEIAAHGVARLDERLAADLKRLDNATRLRT